MTLNGVCHFKLKTYRGKLLLSYMWISVGGMGYIKSGNSRRQ